MWDYEVDEWRGRDDGRAGRERATVWPRPGGCDESFDSRKAAYDDSYFEAVVERDGERNAFLKSQPTSFWGEVRPLTVQMHVLMAAGANEERPLASW